MKKLYKVVFEHQYYVIADDEESAELIACDHHSGLNTPEINVYECNSVISYMVNDLPLLDNETDDDEELRQLTNIQWVEKIKNNLENEKRQVKLFDKQK